MDIVYPLGPHKPELRYSLRSLANVEHDQVWVVGESKPAWAKVEHLAVRNGRGKPQSLFKVFAAVAACDDISEDFIYFNDDFFALRPASIPNWHRANLKPAEPRTKVSFIGWPASCRATGWFLQHQGYPIRDYEIHTPMVLNRTALRETIEWARDHPYLQVRSLYANHHRIGGYKHKEVKIGNRRDVPGNQTWVSTSDNAFASGEVGRFLRDKFSKPSAYEGDEMVQPRPQGVVQARRVRRNKPNLVKVGGKWYPETSEQVVEDLIKLLNLEGEEE